MSVSDTSQDPFSRLLSTGGRAVGSSSDSKWGAVKRVGQRIEGAAKAGEDPSPPIYRKMRKMRVPEAQSWPESAVN